MNKQNLKILVIALFIFSFSTYSQDSLAVKSKCDSLKVVYKTYLEEWKYIETKMKNVGFHSVTNDYTKLRHEWDSLFVDYRSKWNVCEQSKENYFLCIGKKDYDIHSELPPPPPPPQFIEDEICEGWIPVKPPILTEESLTKIQNFIKNHYPIQAKIDSISGIVIVKFICTKEGSSESISITSENPSNLGFGEVAVEAIKIAKFVPATRTRDGKPVKIRMSQKIIFEPPKKD